MHVPPLAEVTELDLTHSWVASLEGIPTNVTHLRLGHKITSLEDIPASVTHLWLGHKITSLENIPASVTHLWLEWSNLASFDGLPVGLVYLNTGWFKLNDMEFPASLQELELHQDCPISFPPGLKKLHLGECCIDRLPTLPADLTHLHLGSWCYTYDAPSFPLGLVDLNLGSHRFSKLPSFPLGLIRLDLGDNRLENLPNFPMGLTHLNLGCNRLYIWPDFPAGVTHLHLGSNDFTSLGPLPEGLISLSLGDKITSLRPLPAGLEELNMEDISYAIDDFARSDFNHLLMAAYYGALSAMPCPQDLSELAEVERAVRVPLRKRWARVVIVVLSSSSVPRVGKRAAVRRLHRADLVQEMAGMLG